MAEKEVKATNEKPEKSKAEKKPKEKKPNFFVRAWRGIKKWCRELKGELKKVQWPTPQQTAKNTATVLVCVLVVGVCIWVFDAVAIGVVRALINLFH